MATRTLVQAKEAQGHRSWATERRIRRLVAEKRIPYYKVGGLVMIDVADLDAYAEAGRVEAVS
jgi:excisionase family DNA binding protein